jgi:hypothetical protein
VLLDLLLSLELLAIFAKLLELVLLAPALGAGLLLCVLGHFELILEALLHVFCGFPLVADGLVLLLELRSLPPQLLTDGLSAVVQYFGLGYLGCELVENDLILHQPIK